MTELLVARARKVVAIEIDRALAQKLQEKSGANPRIEIIQGDILSTDLDALCRRHNAARCFVFGNIPYYITSPIIHHLFSFAPLIRGMALLVQREVADRLTTAPGSRDYGYLSVFTQIHSQPRIALSVPPGAFSPPPRVHSALVVFQMHSGFAKWDPDERKKFLDFVKCCFARKRKSLLNNLAAVYSRERVERDLATLNLLSTVRAEQLALGQFTTLYHRLR